MKKNLLTILLLFLGIFSATAAMTAAQQKSVIDKINKTTSGVKSMTCAFTQTKYLTMLNDKMVSEGKMAYRRADRLRWEYTSPYQYLFIFNGSKVYVGNKSRKDVIDTNTNKVFKEVARLMMGTVTGTVLSGSDDFTVSVSDVKDTWVVTLIPVKKDMKRMFSKINLTFRKNNLMISGIEIYEKNNDRTSIQLRDIVLNSTVNESLFAIPG